MTTPRGRYHVERLELGGWILTDAFETYEAADTWAQTLLDAEQGAHGAGVRVLDTVRDQATHDRVIWEVFP